MRFFVLPRGWNRDNVHYPSRINNTHLSAFSSTIYPFPVPRVAQTTNLYALPPVDERHRQGHHLSLLPELLYDLRALTIGGSSYGDDIRT